VGHGHGCGPRLAMRRAQHARVQRSGLVDIARHVIQRILNPRVLNQLTSYDVASNICQALRNGVPLTSPKTYCAASSEDVRAAVKAARAKYPTAPVLLAGYSLGAYVTGTYLAEEDSKPGHGGSGVAVGQQLPGPTLAQPPLVRVLRPARPPALEPGRYCSPRHCIPSNSRNEGSTCVSS